MPDPALITSAAVVAYLGESAGNAAAVEALALRVEAMLNAACGRTDRPFRAAQAGRVELHDGTGVRHLYLDYPVADLTSVTLGTDHDTPDATLEVDDPTLVQWAVGSRRVRRLDGVFGAAGSPGYVRVTYDAQADVPANAAQALLRMTARLWWQRGSEDATSERIGGAATDLATEPDEVWESVVAPFRSVVG